MNPLSTSCNSPILQRLLDDRLSEDEEDWLARHLDSCESCRHELETLAGSGDQWTQIQSALHQEVCTAVGPTASGTTLVPADGVSALSGDFELQDADFAVNFLEPSDQVDSMGRLRKIEIRSVIGHGGNGIVLKGFQPELNRLVAVKVMAPQLAMSAAARHRFSREAQATAAIVHPAVMPILTVHSDGPLPFLVMPYVDCESLQDRLDRDGALPVLDALRIARQVATGLAAAHAQGLVHRDVKPANILLERGVDRVMLTDFGLARAVDDASLTRTGLIAGTPQYMSPEQARGDVVDTRSDLFSLGSVLYAMLTGRPPFRAATTFGILRRITDDHARPVDEINPQVPSWLAGLVAGLMARQPADRFDRADYIADRFERCIAHIQQPAAHVLPPDIRRLQPRGHWGTHLLSTFVRWVNSPGRAAALTAAIAIVLVLTVQSMTRSSPESTRRPQGSPVSESEVSDAETSEPGAVEAFDESDEFPPRQTSPLDSWHSDIDEELQMIDSELNALFQSLNEPQP